MGVWWLTNPQTWTCQQYSIIYRNDVNAIRSEQVQKHMRKWPKRPWHALPQHYFLSPLPIYWFHRRPLKSDDRWRAHLGLGYRKHLKEYSSALWPLSRAVLQKRGQGRSLRTLVADLDREYTIYIPINGLCPVIWLDGLGLGRNIIGKLVTRKSDTKVMWIHFSERAKEKVKILVFHVNAHQGILPFTEEDLNSQEDRMTQNDKRTIDTSNFLPQLAHHHLVGWWTK